MKRPAETTAGLAGAIGAIVTVAAGIEDVQLAAAIVLVVGSLPAIVTAVVKAGGIRGAVRRIWSGSTA